MRNKVLRPGIPDWRTCFKQERNFAISRCRTWVHLYAANRFTRQRQPALQTCDPATGRAHSGLSKTRGQPPARRERFLKRRESARFGISSRTEATSDEKGISRRLRLLVYNAQAPRVAPHNRPGIQRIAERGGHDARLRPGERPDPDQVFCRAFIVNALRNAHSYIGNCFMGLIETASIHAVRAR